MARTYVVDSSAILAWTYLEAGHERIAPLIRESAISSVNLAEIATVMLARGASVPEMRAHLDVLGLEIIPFDRELAIEAGALQPITRQAGLSLGDRACIATARKFALPVLTTDRAWAGLPLGIEVQIVR